MIFVCGERWSKTGLNLISSNKESLGDEDLKAIIHFSLHPARERLLHAFNTTVCVIRLFRLCLLN